MGLTQGHHLYAALSDNGIQKFLHSVFVARPHYFNYATSGMGGGSPDISPLPLMPVPGSGVAGLDYSLRFTEPSINFFPLANPVGFPLPVKANQFAIYVKGTLCLLSGSTSSTPDLICGSLELWAVGYPSRRPSGADTLIGLSVDQIKVTGTGNLDPIVQFVGQQMLNALLGKVQLSARSLAQGSFGLSVEQGPEISETQLKIWGAIV